MDTDNFYCGIPADLPDEVFADVLETDTLRVERIVSRGHATPEGFWYDQQQNEWVMLLEGAARILLEGQAEAVQLGPGSYLNIPAHKRHRVEWTAPDKRTVWLAIHY